MKALIFATLTFCGVAGVGRAQALQEGYIDYNPGHSPGLMQFSFYWFGEGRFEYATEGCTLFHSYSGTFEQTADSLVLHYYAYPPFTPPPVVGCPTPATPGRSVRVWSKGTQQPLQDVTIVKQHTAIGLATDSLGWAQLPDALAPGDTVVVSAIGFRRQMLRAPAPSEPLQVVLANDDGYGKGGRGAYSLAEWRKGQPAFPGFHPASPRITRKWRRDIKKNQRP